MMTMVRRVAAVAAVVALSGGVSVAAQSKPNFSGKWSLVPDPNAQPAGGGRGRGGFGGLGQAFTAEQNDKTLTVVSTTQMGETKAVYNLDGTDSRNPLTIADNTIDRVSKVKWDGAKLVIVTSISIQGNAIETTQTWSLDSSGSLIVESTGGFGGNQTSSKATYKKQ